MDLPHRKIRLVCVITHSILLETRSLRNSNKWEFMLYWLFKSCYFRCISKTRDHPRIKSKSVLECLISLRIFRTIFN